MRSISVIFLCAAFRSFRFDDSPHRIIFVYGTVWRPFSRMARPLVSRLPVPISMFILERRKSIPHAFAAKRTNGDCKPFLPHAVPCHRSSAPRGCSRLSYFFTEERTLIFYSFLIHSTTSARAILHYFDISKCDYYQPT